MNQQCKVCGEPAAGFHFGAFTCEGCKSFFGRSYNNLSSISECKNGGECVINKKNRTACKACRLRKCLLVGMSKSGSRYGRRSNWFKIHCLLQEQQQQQQQHQQQQQQQQRHHQSHGNHQRNQLQHQQLKQQQTNPTSPSMGIHGGQQRSKEDVLMLGLDDYKNSTSPSISSPESHNSDSSVEVSERRAAYGMHPGFRPLHPAHLHPHGDLSALSKEMMSLPLGFHLGGMSLIPPAFLPPSSLTMFSPYHMYGAPHGSSHPGLMTNHPSAPLTTSPIGSSNSTTTGIVPTNIADIGDICANNNNNNSNNNNNNNNNTNNNNNNRHTRNHNVGNLERSNASPIPEPRETCNKRFYLDAVLKSQRTPTLGSPASSKTRSVQNSPRESPDRDIDCAPPQDNPIDLSMKSNLTVHSEDSEDDQDIDMEDHEIDLDSRPLKRRPIDLTTRS